MSKVQCHVAEQYWKQSHATWAKRQSRLLWERYSWYFLLLAAQQGEI